MASQTDFAVARGFDLDLVTVVTSDDVTLDGALYAPVAADRKPAFLLVHGIRWNFYRGPSRWMGPLLASNGYTCLAMNLRDHDSEGPKGLAGAVEDIDGGVRFLLERSTEVVLLAHGYGCLKAICHGALGRPASERRALTTMGAVGRTHPPLWREALDVARDMGGQTLVVQGAIDHLIDANARAAELRQAAPKSSFEIELLEGGNHYFEGRERKLVDRIVAWEQATRSKGTGTA